MCCLPRDFAHLWRLSVCKEQWWNDGAAEENKRNHCKRLHLYCFVKRRCLKVIQDWTHGYRSPWNWMGKRAAPPKLYRKYYVGLLFIYYLFRAVYLSKVKVKVTRLQALRFCTGRTAYRGSRGIALPFHDHDIRRGWGVSFTPRPLFTPGKNRCPLYRRLGGPQGRYGQVRKISPATGIRSLDHSSL